MTKSASYQIPGGKFSKNPILSKRIINRATSSNELNKKFSQRRITILCNVLIFHVCIIVICDSINENGFPWGWHIFFLDEEEDQVSAV